MKIRTTSLGLEHKEITLSINLLTVWFFSDY